MLTDNPFCARRGDEWWWHGRPREACTELATIDDHIVALAFGGADEDRANHQGLCEGCHGVKSAAEAAHGAGRTARQG